MRFSVKKRSKKTYLRKVLLLAWTLFVAFILRYLIFTYHHIIGDLNYFSTKYTRTALDKLIDANNSSTSLYRILKLLKQQQTQNTNIKNEAIDPEVEIARCQKYGYEYKGRTIRRRIFYGSTIADDSWHAISAHAIEAYDLYHTVAFAESNVTTSDVERYIKPRTLRFPPGSFFLEVMQSGIFGPSTKVYVDQYVDDPQKRIGFDSRLHSRQEDLQRDLSLKRFIDNGMTKEDIAIFSDVDESFTRDFLLAAQLCDIPQFRPGQNCQTPKIVSKTLIFESTPDCITSNRIWFHPDMIIGECIDEIGDSTLHKPGKRLFIDKGRRLPGYGETPDDYEEMPNVSMYPLWRPVDSRVTAGGDLRSDKDDLHIGFHFRNFFGSMDTLRHKFSTFTHASSKALIQSIGEIHDDLNMTINCIKGVPDDKNAESKALQGGFKAIKGPTPIAFQDPIYRQQRFQEAKDMVYLDEKLMKEKLDLLSKTYFKKGEDMA